MKRPPPVNNAQRSGHNLIAMTERQAKRIASGHKESRPSDYAPLCMDNAAEVRARQINEDRRIEAEIAAAARPGWER